MGRSWNFQPNSTLLARINRGAAKGVQTAAEHVLGEAQARAPREEGTLRRSGVASSDPETLRGAVSFDTPYAVRQHEELGYAHTEGEAKYLENALNAEADTVRTIIADSIRGEL